MDKIKLQTVYVPVVGPRQYLQHYVVDINVGSEDDAHELNNRIVLTKQELGQTLLDALVLASEGMPMSNDGKNQLVSQILKSKGIEL